MKGKIDKKFYNIAKLKFPVILSEFREAKGAEGSPEASARVGNLKLFRSHDIFPDILS